MPKEKSNEGTEIIIYGEYPPNTRALEEMNEETRRNLITVLSLLPHFSGYSEEKIMAELMEKSIESEVYINDIQGIKMKFIKLGGSYFSDMIDEESRNELMMGNPENDGIWDVSEVYSILMKGRKKNVAAKSIEKGRGTLVFRPSIWRLVLNMEISGKYNGLYITPLGEAHIGEVEGRIYIISDPSCGLVSALNPPLQREDLNKIIMNLLEVTEEEILATEDLLSKLTPSMHKSLIQKVIRSHANYVSGIDSRLVLLSSLTLLLLHRGSFVPELQKFNTGIESATKRLAVSICEDSYIENYKVIVSLFSAATISQLDPSWKPSLEQISFWFQAALTALEDERYFIYSTKPSEPLPLSLNPYSIAPRLLNFLRSFEGDINMLNSINGKYKKSKVVNRPEIPIYHMIDHHCITSVAYYFFTPQNPSDLFHLLWEKLSGYNPRKGGRIDTEDAFVREARFAQEMVWRIQYDPFFSPLDPQREVVGETKIEYTLDESWISKLVGTNEVKVKGGSAIVTVKPDDVSHFIAIKKPSRGNKEPELKEEEKEAAIKEIMEKYSKGVSVKVKTPAFPGIKEMWLKYDMETGDWSVDGRPWKEIIKTSISLPLYEHVPEMNFENSLTVYGAPGMLKNALNELKGMTLISIEVLRRLIFHISNYRGKIEMFSISRDGSGTDYVVTLEDIEVFKILCYLSYLFPGALARSSLTTFSIVSGPFFWSIRDYIIESYRNRVSSSFSKWKSISDTRKRVLWEHQKDTVNRMKERTEKGYRGHIVWIPVGLGKTLIVLTYISWLIEKNLMPPYIIYSLPPEAMESIIAELKAFNLGINILSGIKKDSNRDIKKNVVNIIKHDHMRMMEEELLNVVPHSFLIIDEFHKVLNPTKRTTVALELSRLSHDFIAMSGTIIKDNNIESLIQWLEQVCEFQVDKENFYVGFSAVISKRVETKVSVERNFIYVMLEGKEKEDYEAYVPPKLGGKKEKPTEEDFMRAWEILYSVCYKKMIHACAEYIREGKGVFVVVRNKKDQEKFREELLRDLKENEIWLITKDTPINLVSGTKSPIKCVITTPQYSQGYDITAMTVMLTSVYRMNDATREQLEGRINRISQKSSSILILIYHSGFLTSILEKHEYMRAFSSSMKGYADIVNFLDK